MLYIDLRLCNIMTHTKMQALFRDYLLSRKLTFLQVNVISVTLPKKQIHLLTQFIIKLQLKACVVAITAKRTDVLELYFWTHSPVVLLMYKLIQVLKNLNMRMFLLSTRIPHGNIRLVQNQTLPLAQLISQMLIWEISLKDL